MYLQLLHPLISPQLSSSISPKNILSSNQSIKNRSFCTRSRSCFVSNNTNKLLDNFNVITARITKPVKAQAESALFDYLHYTRSLSAIDAEHISKNCPNFVENLLGKVKNDEEVSRGVARYLRYFPINEFEPFFESLGLSPGEVMAVLPNDVFFLSDDELMFENYHVLVCYGVPRNRIGKLYKEGREMFRCDYGVLASRLRVYEELGHSKSTIVKLVCSSPSLLVGGVDKNYVNVSLKLKKLGIEIGWITKHMADMSVYNWSRMFDTICFLEKMTRGEKDIGRVFKKHPYFLIEDSGKKLYILVSFLLKTGLSMDVIFELFLKYPKILDGKFAKNLWQAMQFLHEIGMEAEDIAKIVRDHTHILGNSSLRQPATVLRELNIDSDKFCRIVMKDPLKLIELASRRTGTVKKGSTGRGGHVMEKVTFLQSLGYVENSEDMVKAQKKFAGRGDLLQERFDCLVNAGLDVHVVSNMIRLAPPVLNQTKDLIETKINYLVNDVGFPITSLEKFPMYLGYNMEKITLRLSMYKWMKERGRRTQTLSSILACSDARFLKYYVNIHPDGPAEWERLQKSLSSSST
ncbi:hypothetical protein ACHQM5_018751 [Ranunculus cassubicifolius]